MRMARREARQVSWGHAFPGSNRQIPGAHRVCDIYLERDSPLPALSHRC